MKTTRLDHCDFLAYGNVDAVSVGEGANAQFDVTNCNIDTAPSTLVAASGIGGEAALTYSYCNLVTGATPGEPWVDEGNNVLPSIVPDYNGHRLIGRTRTRF